MVRFTQTQKGRDINMELKDITLTQEEKNMQLEIGRFIDDVHRMASLQTKLKCNPDSYNRFFSKDKEFTVELSLTEEMEMYMLTANVDEISISFIRELTADMQKRFYYALTNVHMFYQKQREFLAEKNIVIKSRLRLVSLNLANHKIEATVSLWTEPLINFDKN